MSRSQVEDVRIPRGGEAYLVRSEKPNGAAVLWLHWFDDSANANRSQFLDEAKALAERGVVSLLPQLTFPWNQPPNDLEADLARIEAETQALTDAYDSLAAADGVDSSRIAMVGHDFGAMHGTSLLGQADLSAAVLIAATPRWSDWFLPFWPIHSDRYDYMHSLEPVDPITNVARADCPLLFQFAKADFYIATMTGLELYQAAPEPKELLSYEAEHDMDSAEIREDRTEFLARHLDLSG